MGERQGKAKEKRRREGRRKAARRGEKGTKNESGKVSGGRADGTGEIQNTDSVSLKMFPLVLLFLWAPREALTLDSHTNLISFFQIINKLFKPDLPAQ